MLKRFGTLRSPAILSFARPGYTLTLDFPHQGEKTLRLLELLDAMTVGCGGSVNPYKDNRMSPQTFAASFPRLARSGSFQGPGLPVRILGKDGDAVVAPIKVTDLH